MKLIQAVIEEEARCEQREEFKSQKAAAAPRSHRRFAACFYATAVKDFRDKQ